MRSANCSQLEQRCRELELSNQEATLHDLSSAPGRLHGNANTRRFEALPFQVSVVSLHPVTNGSTLQQDRMLCAWVSALAMPQRVSARIIGADFRKRLVDVRTVRQLACFALLVLPY
jgi:hypothetical protein